MEKVSKAAVNYREAESKERCGNCVMFRTNGKSFATGKCDLVMGMIYKDDTCDEFVKK